MSTVNGDVRVVAKIEEKAWEESDAFCYSDYIVVEPDDNGNTVCPRCHSDDLMRHVQGVGVEYGIEWVMEHIVKTQFEEITDSELEELASDLIDECNPEVTIGGVTFSPSRILLELDKFSFDEWVDSERESLLDSDSVVEVGEQLYRVPAGL